MSRTKPFFFLIFPSVSSYSPQCCSSPSTIDVRELWFLGTDIFSVKIIRHAFCHWVKNESIIYNLFPSNSTFWLEERQKTKFGENGEMFSNFAFLQQHKTEQTGFSVETPQNFYGFFFTRNSSTNGSSIALASLENIRCANRLGSIRHKHIVSW